MTITSGIYNDSFRQTHSNDKNSIDRSVDTNNNNMCFMAIIFTLCIQKIKCNNILLYLALYGCTGIYRNNHFQERTVKMLKILA